MRPVVNVSEAVTVRLKLKLSQLIDVVRSFNFAQGISLFKFGYLRCSTSKFTFSARIILIDGIIHHITGP